MATQLDECWHGTSARAHDERKEVPPLYKEEPAGVIELPQRHMTHAGWVALGM